MASMNRVILVGNITRDPELRNLPSGSAVCELGLAINDAYKNKAGEKVDTTCFVDIVTWGRQAETCAEYLAKGAAVLVEGKLQLDVWEGREGEKRSKMRVRADRVQFLGGKRREGDGGARAYDGPPAGPVSEPEPEDDGNLPF